MRSLVEFMDRHGGVAAVCEGAHAVGRRVFYPAPDALPHFRCRCGRVVAAFMARELEGPEVPTEKWLTQAEREVCGFGRDVVRCDACCEAPAQAGRISLARLREARGIRRRRTQKGPASI